MLLLHNKLLQKAYSAFERGPPKNPALAPPKEMAGSDPRLTVGQPSAIGGIGGSHGAKNRVLMSSPKNTFGDSSVADDFSEDPKSTTAGTQRYSAHGGRQR